MYRFHWQRFVLVAAFTTGMSLISQQAYAQSAAADSQSGQEDRLSRPSALEGPVGFSSFSIGASLIDYEESTRLTVAGSLVDVETDLGAIPTQSSNAYVAIDQKWGFYLFSVSTLGVPQSTEQWEVDEVVIRSNEVSFEQQKIGVLGSLRKHDAGRLLFGARYGKLEFKRFAARLAPAAASLGVTEDTFPDGTVSEAVWDISLLAGYESGTLLGASTRKWQYQWRVMLGVPLVTNVSNTEINDGKVFSDTLNGYAIGLDGLLGYQLTPNFLVGANLQFEVQQRYALDGDLSEEGTRTAFPGTRTVTIIPTLGAYWSF